MFPQNISEGEEVSMNNTISMTYVTREMEGGILARNSVSKEVHVAADSHSMEIRKSTRTRRENIRLQGYTL